jgi:hypothetical protein
LVSDPLLERGRARLIAAVAELPLRYAPFYGRLGALWDMSEQGVHAALLRAGGPGAFRRTALWGVRRLRVSTGPRLAGAEASLLLLAPGARFPAHRHEGQEVALVLEGSYRDAGREYEPGDAQTMPPGSSHALSVSDAAPCVAAVVSRGFAFTHFPLRLLQLIAKSRG